MHLYKTLRIVAKALRSVQVALHRATNHAATAAFHTSGIAKQAGFDALQRQEDKAFNRLMTIKSEVEVRIEEALGDEDAAHWEFHETIETVADRRRMIENEVL